MNTLQQLNGLIDDNENILWYGKPNKKCFLLEAAFNPLLPFALIWALVDFLFIGVLLSSKQNNPMPLWMMIPFFALHLMPVWIYLAGVLFALKNHKNTCFVVTEKGVYSSGGFLAIYFRHKAYNEIDTVSVRQGFFDRKLNVGDVIISDGQTVECDADGFLKKQSNTENNYRFAQQTARVEFGPITIGNKKYRPNTDIIFHDIPDFLEVYHLILEQKQRYKK